MDRMGYIICTSEWEQAYSVVSGETAGRVGGIVRRVRLDLLLAKARDNEVALGERLATVPNFVFRRGEVKRKLIVHFGVNNQPCYVTSLPIRDRANG